MTKPGDGDDFYRVNGAGEMLVFSAADFEDFLVPRPDLLPVMESELKACDPAPGRESLAFSPACDIQRDYRAALNVYEDVNREIAFDGLHWFFDHCETISDRNIERVKALGGGIAVQNRMAFQGSISSSDTGPTSPTDTADPADAGNRRSGWGGYRRNARLKLQPVSFPLLAYHWKDHRGSQPLSTRKSARSGGSTQTLHDG